MAVFRNLDCIYHGWVKEVYLIDPKDLHPFEMKGSTITVVKFKRKYGERKRKVFKIEL
jgi:hypothetical protein